MDGEVTDICPSRPNTGDDHCAISETGRGKSADNAVRIRHLAAVLDIRSISEVTPMALNVAVALELFGTVEGVQLDAVPQLPDPPFQVWPNKTPARIRFVATIPVMTRIHERLILVTV
jgi:hypothetical protein